MRSNLNIILLIIVLAASSCQKVIDIDLNESNPVLVIEGNISDQPGPHIVSLTKTLNFDEPNLFPGVSGAVVTITDNAGNIQQLIETAPGIYETTTNAFVPDLFYTLHVDDGSRKYLAESYMAPPAEIDTIVTDSLTFGAQSNKYIKVIFQDPAGVKNFYRIIQIINGDTLETINLSNDEFNDGNTLTADIFSDMNPRLESGDTVTIELQCIDERVFDYFVELIEVINRAAQSAAPANPVSHINGGALGYFNAYSVRSKTIVVP